jgi:hypothetical protein
MAKSELADNFGEKELIPLFKKTLSSITKNPIFYPHGMGYDFITELTFNLQKHEIMKVFDAISLYKTWDMLTKAQQEKFSVIVDSEKSKMKYFNQHSKLNLDLLWKLSRSNTNLQAMCCGDFCKISMKFGKQKNISYIILDSYKTNNTYHCGLGYIFSFNTWAKYKREQWEKFHLFGRLIDMNCDGNLPELNFDNNKIEIKFRKLYKEIFKLIDPVKTLQHAPIEQCDL